MIYFIFLFLYSNHIYVSDIDEYLNIENRQLDVVQMVYWWFKNWNCLRTVGNYGQMSSILICYNRNGKNMIEIKNEWRDLRRIDMKRTDVMKGSALKPRTVGRKHSRPLVRSLMFCNAAVCVVLQQHQYHSSLTAPCLSTQSLTLSFFLSLTSWIPTILAFYSKLEKNKKNHFLLRSVALNQLYIWAIPRKPRPTLLNRWKPIRLISV